MKIKTKSIILLIFLATSKITSLGAVESDGAQLANESMALVSYAAISNLGANDPECRNGQFERFDINALVDAEVAPVIDRWTNARPGSITQQQRTSMLGFLKNMKNHPSAASGIVQMYNAQKSDAIAQYGIAAGCPALATMVRTVIHQKKLALRRM